MAHAWMPNSPCGPGCLSSPAPRVRVPHRVLRLVCAALMLLCALALAPMWCLLRGTRGKRVAQRAFVGLLRAFGVRLRVYGGPDLRNLGRGALVVSNHISWLDTVALNAVQPMRSLAKQEIANWPVLGGIVRRVGSIFVDRQRLSSLPDTVAELAAALRRGAQVHVAPEGTTWCGLASGPFATASFQAAIEGGVPVRPVALRYRLVGGRETTQPAFVGTESLVTSVRRVAAIRGLVLEVHVCSEIAPGRADNRAELAELAESTIASALDKARIRNRRRGYLAGSAKPVSTK